MLAEGSRSDSNGSMRCPRALYREHFAYARRWIAYNEGRPH